METMKTNCTGMHEKLADLLFDPAAVPAKVQAHVAECEHCEAELEELKATMNLLDAWEAPEPSPYFLTRLGARMREERAKDCVSLDAVKISAIQISTGSQYLRNARNLSTANQSRIRFRGQPEFGAWVIGVWRSVPQKNAGRAAEPFSK